MTFRQQETIDRVIARCIRDKYWLSSCQDELRSYSDKSERRAVDAYAKQKFDAAGAGHAGRWQS